MAATEQRVHAGRIVLQAKPRREITRLPLALAIPLIGILSLALWMALFRLFALLV
jgi:hypothetical protein